MAHRDLPVFHSQFEPLNSTTTPPSIGRSPTEIQLPGNGIVDTDLIVESIGSTQTLLHYLQLFWANRRLLLRTAVYALVASIAIAFLIPVRYQSVTRLMPPDSQSGSGLGLLAAMAERGGVGGIGGVAGDLLGIKSSGALFVGILGSDTVEDGLINKFQLKKV